MRKIYISLLFLIVGLTGLKAQRVSSSGSGTSLRVFIHSEGLPMYSQCPDHIPVDYFYANHTINGSLAIILPAKNFEVSRSESAHRIDAWANGSKFCKDLNENGGNWRVPNQKELFLIYTLRYAIESKSGFTGFQNNFYMAGLISSETEKQQNKVDLTNGNSSSGSPQSGYYVRCVRDIF